MKLKVYALSDVSLERIGELATFEFGHGLGSSGNF